MVVSPATNGLAELTEPLGTDALKKRSEQPPTHVPRKAERPGQDRRARVEAAIEIYTCLRTVDPFHEYSVVDWEGRGFHGAEDLTGEVASTGGVEGERGGR